MRDDAAVLDAIASIADGRPVDWSRLEPADGDASRRLLRDLHAVAGIASLHRTLGDEDAASSSDAVGNVLPFPSILDAGPATGKPWGHLHVGERVGRGAFGDVYRAHDPQLQRDVALKILHRDVASTPARESRLLDEARALARVRHHNVVTVHGADRRDGQLGLWMELVEGQTLEERLQLQGPCDAREAAAIVHEVAGAVSAVHAAGLIHRDIKAQNVIRERGGRLVLMDFGAGEALDQEQPVRLAGTPLYIAPEVLDGGRATVQSDVYALGVLLYYLVTGRYPVNGASLDDLRSAHETGRVGQLRDERPGLPDGFVRVVERALAPDPSLRHQSAGALQADLARVITGAEPAGSWALGPRWAAALILAALGLLVAVGVVASRMWPGSNEIRSVAVLPLRDTSGGQEYFADGMTEALINELAGVRGLRVCSRTSVMRFKGEAPSLPEVASALHVDGVIEGSVQRSEDRVRITLRLIHAGTETPLWARTFERSLRDVLLLQTDVARAVAEHVRGAITGAEPRTAGQRIDPEAHDAYLRARFEAQSARRDDLLKAVASYRRAIELAPGFAPAHAGLSQTFLTLLGTYRGLPRQEGIALTRAAATQATEIDGGSSEAWVTLGQVAFYYDYDFPAADRAFRRALEVNPSSALGIQQYAMFRCAQGRVDEALRLIAEGRAADPLSVEMHGWEGITLYYAHRWPEAQASFDKAIELAPRSVIGHIGLARVLVATGEYDRALSTLDSLEALSGPTINTISIRGQAHARAGRAEQAETALARLRDMADPQFIGTADQQAYVHAALGQRDEALRLLEQSLDGGHHSVMFLAVDPRVDSLRDDPRFERMLDRLGVRR